MYNDFLGFFIVITLILIGLNLFIWILNLLNNLVIYPEYITNTSEFSKNSISNLFRTAKECIAFICMVIVAKNFINTYFKVAILFATAYILIELWQVFKRGVLTLIQLHVVYTLMRNGDLPLPKDSASE